MKRISAGLLFVLPVLAYGQDIRYQNLPLLEVDRAAATAQQQAAKPAPRPEDPFAWKQQLKQLQERFAKLPAKSQFLLTLPPVEQVSLPPSQETRYMARLLALQQRLSRNTALAGYSFVAPIATDLARLSADNYAALTDFLADSPSVHVQTQYPQPFTLALQIKGTKSGALELWINELTKKVYLMSDNLYNTSAGKYGLHLR